jgi:eukaryotic-like serine/threonine-protein kinase
MGSSSTPLRVARFGIFEADFQAGELRKAGIRIKLQDQPFQVLTMLLEHPGELVTREDIRKKLWPGDTFVDFDHGLNNAVNRLREALGDSADVPRFIETLPRRGYRFVAQTNGTGAAPARIISEVFPTDGKSENTRIDAVLAKTAEIPKRRSHRWLLFAAPLMVAFTLLIAFRPWKTAIPPSRRSFVLPPDGTRFNLIRDSGGSVALSPDGTKLAFVAIEAKGTARIWVRPLGSLTAQALEGTEGATFPFWSPDGRSIAFFSDADRKLKRINLAGGLPIALCEAPFGRGGSWSQSGVIVFTPNTYEGLYKIPASGGTPEPVTHLDTSIHTTHRWPKFLPDGHHFIYLAVNHLRDASHDAIYLGSLDGKENKRIISSHADATYASGYLFFLLKDVLMAQPFDAQLGQLRGEPRSTVEKVVYDPSIWKAVFDASETGVMAYQYGSYVNGSQLRWFDRSGKPLEIVAEAGFYGIPVLSPDGRKLLAARVAQFGNYGDLWVFDLARGVRTRITFDDADNAGGIWSHDGKRILLGARGRYYYSIYETDSSGGGNKRLILDAGGNAGPIGLSPDGRFLLYGRDDVPGLTQGRLWVYPMSGQSPPFPLLERGTQLDGQISSDGRWVVYTSNESGRNEVYVVPFRPPPQSSTPRSADSYGKWQISTSGGQQPRWRRDGRELFYVAADNTLMSVPVTSSGSRFEVGAAHPLFRANLDLGFVYDVSPDGSRFIMNTAAPETTAPITLVENWPSDFAK